MEERKKDLSERKEQQKIERRKKSGTGKGKKEKWKEEKREGTTKKGGREMKATAS